MLLMIDNYDSFTYNLVQYCQALGVEPKVVRNDDFKLQELIQLNPDAMIVSPGPCTPDEAGVSLEAIDYFYTRIPVLGVCLGHQAIAQVLGGRVVHADKIMHGKVSEVSHDGSGVFFGLPSPFRATRYHSLVVDPQSLPQSLRMNAWVEDTAGAPTIMGFEHKRFPVAGVQFHPESIESEHGHQLLKNFLDWPKGWPK